MSENKSQNFIERIVEEDNASGLFGNKIHTRFPPEPNGYLHLGHAKSITLNFGTAIKYGGKCNLRFDDTNPTKEEQEYVDSIIKDVKWLGYDWGERLFYASDYFERLYDFAETLINKGKAYVDDLSADEIRAHRGTLTEPGKESPFRNRSIDENLRLFRAMKNGEFPDGSKTLRAKIDMASGNINMRDPVMYRILRAEHHRTGGKWVIYPTYDWAHGQSDFIEGITHSVCTLEFEDHRPLYEWFLNALEVPPGKRPKQIEFARLNLTHTVLSKRKLIRLVSEGFVKGWDDPRMPTISGIRRRGFTPDAIKAFCDAIGVAKSQSTVEIGLLEHCLREDLNKSAQRVMAVLRPIKVIITNYPEGKIEELEAENNPEDPSAGKRAINFSREIFIEQDDFREEPPKKFFRLAPGREVRLKHAYIIKCEEVIKDPATGEIKELLCTYDPTSRSGGETSDRKIKGTLHWVSAHDAVKAEVRLFDYLFTKPFPDSEEDFTNALNPKSLEVLKGCLVEPSLKGAPSGKCFQFLRMGYFAVDPDSAPDMPVFNRTITLKDTWAKIEKKGEAK